jgi:hypothetical protein
VEIPAGIQRAIGEEVARNLETELGNRGLLLAAGALAEAEAELAQRGTRLLTSAISVCYSISRLGDGALTIEFQGGASEARLGGALAFGASTASVLVAGRRPFERPAGSIELLCALFNLGIGLIDGICDTDAETGVALLELIQSQDLSVAAEEPPVRGWLSAALPPALAHDAQAAFTVEVVEAFFETLHVEYPHDAWHQLRRRVGIQLGEALDAERQSVARPADRIPREQLIAWSRRTSVLPFQIIETLACGNEPSSEPTAGTQLGEAMWRIDDLVDLCDDARSGALNGILLTATTGKGRPGERDRLVALERLLVSTEIASLSGEAADRLLIGLRLACPGSQKPASDLRSAGFLSFIQRYAGIKPRAAS